MKNINQKKVIRIDKDGNTKEYDSVSEAASDTGIVPTQVSRSNRTQTSVKGFRFAYPNELKDKNSKVPDGKDHELLTNAKNNYNRLPYYMTKNKVHENKV